MFRIHRKFIMLPFFFGLKVSKSKVLKIPSRILKIRINNIIFD